MGMLTAVVTTCISAALTHHHVAPHHVQSHSPIAPACMTSDMGTGCCLTHHHTSQAKATQTASRQSHMGGLSMGFAFFSMFALYGLIIYFGGW
jgi:hypothetical protein